MNQCRFIRIRELASTKNRPGLLPVSPSTIWRLVRAGDFPAPVKLAERVTAWRYDDVSAFIEKRADMQA